MSNALVLRPRALAAIVAVTLVGIGAFTWPLVLGFSTADSAHTHDAPWIFLIMLPLLLLVVAAEIADGGIDAKAVALLGVLAGACAVLRPITGGVTGVQLMFFLLVPAGRVFGPGFGFVLGNVAMFASAALTGGGGPWLPFQMLAAGWVGLCAGCLPRMRGRVELWLLAGYGLLAGIAYGFVLNLWFWPFGTTGTGASAAVTFVPGAPLRREPAPLAGVQRDDQPGLRHPTRPGDRRWRCCSSAGRCCWRCAAPRAARPSTRRRSSPRRAPRAWRICSSSVPTSTGPTARRARRCATVWSDEPELGRLAGLAEWAVGVRAADASFGKVRALVVGGEPTELVLDTAAAVGADVSSVAADGDLAAGAAIADDEIERGTDLLVVAFPACAPTPPSRCPC